MSELTDYEINKRLAEIAGVDVYDANGKGVTLKQRTWRFGPKWSPLTNWSQLGDLIKSQDISFWTVSPAKQWSAECPYRLHGMMEVACADSEVSPERAICLSIIAAHSEEA